MRIIRNLSKVPPLKENISLTIGTFDGLHLGHQTLLHHLQHLATKDGTSVIVSFDPTPFEILHPEKQKKTIFPLELRKKVLAKMGIDLLILLPFSKKIANQTHDQFLNDLHKKIPFSHLVFGKEAAFGKDLDGKEETISSWGETKGINTHYIPLKKLSEEPISSSRIRTEIEKGDLDAVSKLLEMPFFVYLNEKPLTKISATKELYSWKLNNQCLPPPGYLYEMSFTPSLEKGQESFSGYVTENNELKIWFNNPIDMPEKDFVLFFLNKMSAVPNLELPYANIDSNSGGLESS